MVSPYRGDYVSQEHEDGGGYAGHAGIDLVGPVGRPVYAPYDGVIEKAAWGAVTGRSGYGKVLRNYDGEAQYFGHLRDISGPGVGAKVKAGDVIEVRPKSAKSGYFAQINDVVNNSVQGPLSWLKSDSKKLKIEVTGQPKREEAEADINEQLIVEFYSR